MPPPMVAAGGAPPEPEPEREKGSILCDLQDCISEPIRIIHYGALHLVRRLFFILNRASVRGTAGHEETGTGEKEFVSAVADGDEYNHGQLALADDDDDLNNSDDDDDDYPPYDMISEPDWDLALNIRYHGDSPIVKAAYSYSRSLVEILSVRPHDLPFAGHIAAFNDCSIYSCCSSHNDRQPLHHNLDSQGNLVLKTFGVAIEDYFSVKVQIPSPDDDDDDDNYDFGNLLYIPDPYEYTKIITRNIRTLPHFRGIEVTFVPLYRAIQATVHVYLDLTTSGSSPGTIYYVYGEITAHHKVYGDKNNVVLFLRGEEDKAEVIDGKLALQRNWAAVPIYLDPLLIIKLSLGVVFTTNNNLEDGIISFQGDLTFERDQYRKRICNADDHGKVEVKIEYR